MFTAEKEEHQLLNAAAQQLQPILISGPMDTSSMDLTARECVPYGGKKRHKINRLPIVPIKRNPGGSDRLTPGK